MATWRDELAWRRSSGQLEKASFRDAYFFIDTSEAMVGRRVEPHYQGLTNTDAAKVAAYAGLKAPENFGYLQDLGPDLDEFKITGYVIQNADNGFNHFKERNALITALKTPGPGMLVHPFYGIMDVSLKERAKISESLTSELGISRFEMTFTQYKKPIFKQQEPDWTAKVDTSALSTINAALDGFTAQMRTYGAFLGSLTGPINGCMGRMQNAINSVKGAVASTISAATGIISQAISLANTLLTAPCDLANQFMDAAGAIKGLVGMAGDVVQGGIVGACSGETRGDVVTMDGATVKEDLGVSVCEQIGEQAVFEEADVATNTPVEQENNVSLIVSISQIGMLATACQIAIRIDFSNQDDMEYILKLIADAFDNLIDRLGAVDNDIDDPLTFQKVCQLRSDFVDSMYSKNTGLTKQVDYEVPSGIVPSLVLAYDRYEDIERENEIMIRNRETVHHPGFLPSGDVLRILNE